MIVYKNRIKGRYRWTRVTRFLMSAILVSVSTIMATGSLFWAQAVENPGPLGNVTSVANATLDIPPPLLEDVPEPTGLDQFVKDRAALLKLGKALFWDMQVGSDGIQACASCHFHAGADNRIKNQVSPGVLADPKDTTFQLGGAPNYTLMNTDFPLSTDSDMNDTVSSQGVFSGEPIDPDGFQINVNGVIIKVRRVEPRNTPTVINAVFNRLQLWDGHAKDQFNGVTPFGANPQGNYPVVYRAPTRHADWEPFDIIQDGGLNNTSLASIAVGPVTSLFEMTSEERTFPDVQLVLKKNGHKLKSVRPLAKQIVSPTDSVLGTSSRSPKLGLIDKDYAAIIEQAFKREWWDSNVKQDGYTLIEQNFSLYWGLALQEYLSTLKADAGPDAGTPFDRYQAGDESALTPQEISGLQIFTDNVANGGGNCSTCHVIPEFTRASVRRTLAQENLNGTAKDSTIAANGFFTNFGVRRPGDDPGAGTSSAFPNPPDTPENTFRAPTLRNIALTAPYMHTGRFSTLEQVVDFYNQGRNDGEVQRAAPLGLTQQQLADLVAFLRCGLTDERVILERAPFDHPQLFVPNGHPGDEHFVTPDKNGNATDELMEIPAVGGDGVATPISANNFDVKLGVSSIPCPARP
ncbi:MAG: c-type cytochrome [Desulfatitalea sp.]|nr:c-type cytochrome [Desulfatitalea sp.]NNK02528.1 c-type cytochrome [Desulfatitalea sp.]